MAEQNPNKRKGIPWILPCWTTLWAQSLRGFTLQLRMCTFWCNYLVVIIPKISKKSTLDWQTLCQESMLICKSKCCFHSIQHWSGAQLLDEHILLGFWRALFWGLLFGQLQRLWIEEWLLDPLKFTFCQMRRVCSKRPNISNWTFWIYDIKVMMYKSVNLSLVANGMAEM